MKQVGKIFHKRTIRKAPLDGKTVLVRADYNVPMAEGVIDDDFRLRASLPTLQALLARGCRVVIIAHLGRPDGRDASLSLAPIADRLAELLDRPVQFIDQTTGPKVKSALRHTGKPSVTLLENLRYHPEEEANDLTFARQIVHDTGAAYFVQDGFGVVHRAHASTSAIAQCLPSVAGLLLEREYTAIVGAMKRPRRPLVAVLGGAKVSDKIEVLDALTKVADQMVIGGAMGNTFLAARGHDMGASKVEPKQEQLIHKIIGHVERKVGVAARDSYLLLPSDVAVARTIDTDQKRRVVAVDAVTPDDMALDIGDASIERAVEAINRAQTVIWNGTLGMAELPEFAHGSARIALALAEHPNVTSIIGGGDTADFVIHWDARHGGSFTHVSTGGGASIELMAGRKLPGIEVLLDA